VNFSVCSRELKLLLHILDDTDTEFITILRGFLEGHIQLTTGPIRQELPPFEALVAGRPDKAALDYSPNLESLFIPFAGVPPETRTLIRSYPTLRVYNLHHNARTTAELALALLLAASKNLLTYDKALRRADWTPRYEGNPGFHLQGCRVCVLGFGSIGREIGVLCKAVGMKVEGIRFSASPGEVWNNIPIYPPDALHSLLENSQILILSVPLTEKTVGIIGEEELKLLQRPSVLVNIARGSIVDEAALYHALLDGTLFAAGLDVWYQYPSSMDERTSTWPSRYPFQELPNVVLSPHRGGAADSMEYLRAEALARLLSAASRGETLWNQVDLQRGY
jgi:phosphoglycerate dehydrogenase-like enzyme